MLSELALAAAIVAGVSFVGQLRRLDARPRGYTMVLAGVLAVSILATLRADPFWSVVAVSLVVLVVVLPWVLDGLVRLMFARERLALAVRLAGWRAMLMPGAGLGRQQIILRGLALLEQRGVDEALAYFRSLAHETDDDFELRLIHEQIVSMLLFGQRWSEGIAHYEARFPPGYAAHRPPLALGLLRAYGESGRLSRAAGLLQAIEHLLGRDPQAAGVVSQARLTFLAYAGETDSVNGALTDDRRHRLGLSAASGALFRGIALSRAGQSAEAELELRRVAELATPRDDRVVHASRKAIDGMPTDVVQLEPELRTYADRVADRLELFLRAAPVMRRRGALRITPLLLLVLVAGYAAVLLLDGGGVGLLRLGAATPQRVWAGGVARLLTGLWVQTDPVTLLLCIYGVWLAGPLIERVYGRGRLLLVSVGSGVAGLTAACALSRDPTEVLAGGVLLTTGLVAAAATLLLSARNALPRRTRRVLVLPLVLLLLALAVMIPQDVEGLRVSAVGMIAAVLFGLVSVALAPPHGLGARLLSGLGVLLALVGVACAGWVALDDARAFDLEHRVVRRTGGGTGGETGGGARGRVVLDVPQRFGVVLERQPAGAGPWPIHPGLHDRLAERVGDRVQVLITTASEPDDPSALLRVDEALAHEVLERPGPPPERWLREYRRIAGDDEAEALRSTLVLRNGEVLGVVIERALDATDDAVVLVAAPAEALEHDATLYAAIVAEARPEG